MAQLTPHTVAQLHHPVIDAVEIFLVLLVPLSFCFPGRQSFGIVSVFFERSQLRERIDAPLKGDLRGGDEFLVLLHQVVLLLHKGDQCGGKTPYLDLEDLEDDRTELLFELRPERALNESPVKRLNILLHLRGRAVPELHLFVVKFDAGVDGMTDKRKVRLCGDLLVLVVHGDKGISRFLVCLGGFQIPRDLRDLFPDHLDLRPLIWHFVEFHAIYSPPSAVFLQRSLNVLVLCYRRSLRSFLI